MINMRLLCLAQLRHVSRLRRPVVAVIGEIVVAAGLYSVLGYGFRLTTLMKGSIDAAAADCNNCFDSLAAGNIVAGAVVAGANKAKNDCLHWPKWNDLMGCVVAGDDGDRC